MYDKCLNSKFVVISVPLCWIRTYHKLLELLSCYAEHKLYQQQCKCADHHAIILECYDLFLGAIASYKLNRRKEAQDIINHIDCVLSCYDTSDEFTIDLNGKIYYVTPKEIKLIEDIKAVVSRPILYGFVDYDTIEGSEDTGQYLISRLSDKVLQGFEHTDKKCGEIIVNLPKNDYNKLLVILVPESECMTIKKDDGFGNRVYFEGSHWKANGNLTIDIDNAVYSVKFKGHNWHANGDYTIDVNDAIYRVYGQTYTTYGNVKFYIQ